MSGHVNDHMLDTVGRGHINDGLYKFFGGGASPLDPDSTLFYDFAVTKDLIDEVSGIPLTFVRAGDAEYLDSAGVWQTATANEPRFDHEPGTNVSLGLLIEDSRTNLVLQSNDFAQANWVKSGNTSIDNTGLTIDGMTNVTEMTFDDLSAQLFQQVSVLQANTYGCAIYIRTVTGTNTVRLFTAGAASTELPIDTTWRRLDDTAAPNGDGNRAFGIRSVTAGASQSVYITRCQSELVAVGFGVSSYIPTVGSTESRAAESTILNDMSWFNQNGPGTLYTRYIERYDQPNPMIYSLSDGSNANYMELVGRSNEIVRGIKRIAAVSEILDSLNLSTPIREFNKAAQAWDVNDYELYVNGGRVGTGGQTLDNLNGATVLHLGNSRSLLQHINGHIVVFAYANVRKDNAFLADVTTP